MVVGITIPVNEPVPAMQEPRVEEFIPDKDAWEDWSAELYAADSRELDVDLTITYHDRNSKITNREITVEKYSLTPDGGLLAAFCHLRKARRPFHFSRIQFAADRTDGTRIKDLGAWLDAKYEISPKGVRDRFKQSTSRRLVRYSLLQKRMKLLMPKRKRSCVVFAQPMGLVTRRSRYL
jgi:hypothetical protein